MKKISKQTKAMIMVGAGGMALGIVGTIIGVKCIANGKYANNGTCALYLKEEKVSVKDSDVADLIRKHTKPIDRLNYKKMIAATIAAQDILATDNMPEKKNWRLNFKNKTFG